MLERRTSLKIVSVCVGEGRALPKIQSYTKEMIEAAKSVQIHFFEILESNKNSQQAGVCLMRKAAATL